MMMKKRSTICFTAGIVLLLCFAFSGIAEAAMGVLTVQFKSIKLFFDGQEAALGTQMVNINGSNYVPVKALATALDKEIVWDGATQTISIGAQEAAVAADSPKYRVQVGAFADKANAEALLKQLKAAGFDGYIRTE